MLKEEKIELKKIGKLDELFKVAIKKLSTNVEMNALEKSYILACAIIFLKYYEKDRRYISFADFSYYIILKYSLSYNDFAPLYDFSTNFGFYPITKIIIENELLNNFKISDYFVSLELDRFKNRNSYIETLEQHLETKRFLSDTSNEKSYLAPTSFGKSALIIEYIKILKDKYKIAIIVPTKSLLAQTHRMIREAKLNSKVIIHDEMYNNDSSFIAIFTQERALRLLKRNDIYFDILFIDEAHNILNKDSRSILLTRLVAKNAYRNPDQKVIYLSPLIENADNLKIKKTQKIDSYSINFNVKEPEIFEYRLNNSVAKYDRFTDQFYELYTEVDKFEYLRKNSEGKNFLYNYTPIGIEALASKLSTILPEIEVTSRISDLEKILKKEVHKDFYAINYLKFGIVYLHGKLPDLIKEYLENKFRLYSELKYVVANKVILEGMNLPIDCLFIFNTRKLQGKELMNLLGRVNRLNNIFSAYGNNLGKLLPKIHFINSVEYNGIKGNMENKVKLLRSRTFEDVVENPILNSFDFEKLKIGEKNEEKYKKEVKCIQENEEFLYSKAIIVEDQYKQYLIETGINDFYSDIKSLVDRLPVVVGAVKSGSLSGWGIMSMMDKINYIFIHNINFIIDPEFERLKYPETRKYYEHYILYNQKMSLNENINSQVRYFKEKAASNDKKMYFGPSYGEEVRESESYVKPVKKAYIDLSKKSDPELVNLAIAKIKIEEDFISFKLSKFIEMMYDYKLISEDEYNTYIYGTIDRKKIDLTKYGLSVSLITRLEKDNQINNLEFDEFNNLKGNSEFKEFEKNIDDFYRFEIDRYLS